MADNGGAIAVAVVLPVVIGGGGLAVYMLTREGGKPAARQPQPSVGPPPPQPAGGIDGIFGAGTTEAVGVLATSIASEGARVVTSAAKEVGSFVKQYHPAVLAYQGTKQVVGDVKAGVGTVYRDVRSGVGDVYNGTKAVAKGAIKYHPVTLGYKGGKAVVSATAHTVKSTVSNVAKKLKFW
jgi:hypothetical protein